MSDSQESLSGVEGSASLPSSTRWNIRQLLRNRELGQWTPRSTLLTQRLLQRNTLRRYEKISPAVQEPSTSTGASIATAFSPDGGLVATTHSDHSVRVWKWHSQGGDSVLLRSWTHPRTPWTVHFHPRSERFVCSADLSGLICLWDVQVGDLIASVSVQNSVPTITFDPETPMILVSCQKRIHVWDVSNYLVYGRYGSVRRTTERAPQRPHPIPIWRAFNHNIMKMEIFRSADTDELKVLLLAQTAPTQGRCSIHVEKYDPEMVLAARNSPENLPTGDSDVSYISEMTIPHVRAYSENGAVISHDRRFLCACVVPPTETRESQNTSPSNDSSRIRHRLVAYSLVAKDRGGEIASVVLSPGPQITSLSLTPDDQFLLAGFHKGPVLFNSDELSSVVLDEVEGIGSRMVMMIVYELYLGNQLRFSDGSKFRCSPMRSVRTRHQSPSVNGTDSPSDPGAEKKRKIDLGGSPHLNRFQLGRSYGPAQLDSIAMEREIDGNSSAVGTLTLSEPNSPPVQSTPSDLFRISSTPQQSAFVPVVPGQRSSVNHHLSFSPDRSPAYASPAASRSMSSPVPEPSEATPVPPHPRDRRRLRGRIRGSEADGSPRPVFRAAMIDSQHRQPSPLYSRRQRSEFLRVRSSHHGNEAVIKATCAFVGMRKVINACRMHPLPCEGFVYVSDVKHVGPSVFRCIQRSKDTDGDTLK